MATSPSSGGVFGSEWQLTYDPTRTVYVANIAKDLAEKTLKDFFNFAGSVVKLQITEQGSADTNYAFVEFATQAAAGTAASVLTNTNLQGKIINVQPATAPGVPALPDPSNSIASSPSSVSVGQAGVGVGGPGSSNVGVGNGALGIPAQFLTPGVVPPTYQGDPHAGGIVGGYNQPPRQMPQVYGTNMQTPEEVARTVYVGNINGQVTAQQLMNFFATCGPINFCRMAGDDTHPSRFAFIEFATMEAGVNAMSMNGVQLVDKQLRVNRSKNPIVRPVPRETENAEREKRERRLRAVIASIHRRIGFGAGSDGSGGGDHDQHKHHRSSHHGDRDREGRKRSRSRSRDRHHRSSSSRHYSDHRDRDRDRERDREGRRGDRDRDRERDRDYEHHDSRRHSDRHRDRDRDSDRDRDRERGRERDRDRDGERKDRDESHPRPADSPSSPPPTPSSSEHGDQNGAKKRSRDAAGVDADSHSGAGDASDAPLRESAGPSKREKVSDEDAIAGHAQ